MDRKPRPCDCGFYDAHRHHSAVGSGRCHFYEARTLGWSSDACGEAAIWYSPDGRKVAARHLRKALAAGGE